MTEQSTLERAFSTLRLQIAPHLPEPVSEYEFARAIGRGWRLDFAWPQSLVAVEIEGITHRTGRHQRVEGYSEDCLKYNTALMLGWRVLRFTGQMLEHDPFTCFEQLCELVMPAIENSPALYDHDLFEDDGK